MPEAFITAPGPLANESVRVTASPVAFIVVPGPFGPERVTAGMSRAYIQVDGPLTPQRIVALSDYSALIPDDYPLRYEMQLTTPSGLVRVPISSWQATLQTGVSSYVQCVVPGADPWESAIESATRFDIYRVFEVAGIVTEYAMAAADVELAQFDRGARRHTCVISGHSGPYEPNPDPLYDRPLIGVRSVTTDSGGVRVRCDIDFLLQPGHRVVVDEVPFEVAFINHYVTRADAYMDVGERL